MYTQEHKKNDTALFDFLLQPAEPGLTEPPSIPPSLDGLSAAVYLDAALRYVEQYPFDREFYKCQPKKRELFSYTVDSKWKEKARTYLQAFINVDRSALAPLRTSGSYDAAHEKQEFARKIIFPRRWKLEELASEMLALVEFVQMGQTSFALVEALTGIKCEDWVTNSIEYAFLAQPQVQELFGSFQLYLEWTDDRQIMIRGRTGEGNPRPFLQTIVNDRLQLCAEPGEFLDAPVRPRSNTTIADIDPIFFILHKFVGDIVWMCGGPEPAFDNEEDDEEDMVVSDTNIGILLEKLRSPAMDLVPREQEVLFGSSMVLVQKDTVWV
ncbi:hypothetical protein B0H14DRAFT_3674831 [Mycena olivaceomarginata]|nr:hypothetical protein B0H14DRAFT_3674831 [Mycena olivaceomarginata]